MLRSGLDAMGQLGPGDLINGKYRILKLIGEGGMGSVYAGENVKIHRKVAIKTLLAAVADNGDVVTRFEREATAAGRIGNAHILEVLDLGEMDDGDRYMVMELLEGEPLSDRIESRGQLTPEEITPIMLQVLDGLGAAHEAGIIHRDLKPDNIFLLTKHLGTNDFVKLIDFGISKFQPLSGDSTGMSMTRTGAVMGTPYYMSPEQASGARETDRRTDLYALGVILYQAVCGQVPFDAPTFNQLIFKIALSEPPPIATVAPHVDAGFATIVAKAMARDIDARFQSTAEFRKALQDWQASGAAVPVPPAPDRLSMEAAVLSAGSRPIGGTSTTAGNWAASQAESPPPAKGNSLVVGLGLAAAVVLGLGGTGAYALLGGATTSNAATPNAGVSAQQATTAPTQSENAEAAKPPAPIQDEEPDEASATEGAAGTAVDEAREATVEAAPTSPTKRSKPTKATARRAPATHATSKPTPTPAAPPVPAPASPPKPRQSGEVLMDDMGY